MHLEAGQRYRRQRRHAGRRQHHGRRLHPGFEVQYRAGNIGIINATYDIYQNGRPTKMGTFTVRMTYDWTGETSMAITSRSGDHDAHYTLLQPDDTDDAWVEFT